jgi:hypothetical protein
MARRNKPWTLDEVLANGERTPEGCLLWKGYMNGLGYGRVKVEGRVWVVHRYVWTKMRGPIPDGMTLDHTCHNEAAALGLCVVAEGLCPHRRCYELDHLRITTQRENWLAGRQGGAAKWRGLTHCLRGHPFDEANTTRLSNGNRLCKTCSRMRAEKYRAARRAAQPPKEPDLYCPRGHLRSEHQRRTYRGIPYCLACLREKTRERRARLREQSS